MRALAGLGFFSIALFMTNAKFAMAAPASVENVRAVPAGQTRMYSFDVNTDDMSRGVLKGRYRVITQVMYTLPQNEVNESTTETNNDVTGPGLYVDLVYEEKIPWVRSETTLFEVGTDGNLVRTVAHQTCNSSPRSTMLPNTMPFSKDPIVTLWEGCELNAQAVTDTISGHKLLFNFEGKNKTYFSLIKTAPGRYRVGTFFGPQIDSMEAVIKIIDNVYTMSTQEYKFHELSHEGVNASLLPCDRVGAVQNITPLVFPDGATLARAEICYRSGAASGFERIVVPLFNPARDPNVAEATRIALQHEGHLATKPLFKVGKMSEVNCHGYAISALVPKRQLALPAGATWLEGGMIGEPEKTPNGGEGFSAISVGFSKGTYPFETILRAHFHLVKTYLPIDGEFAKSVKQLRDAELKVGDLITMIDGVEYMHSGVIVHGPHGFWIQSKLGEGPIVETPLQSLLDVYTAREIRIYRLK